MKKINKFLKVGMCVFLLIGTIYAGATLLTFFGRMDRTVNIDTPLFMYNGTTPLEEAVIASGDITQRGNQSFDFNITKLDGGNATIYFNITDFVEDGVIVTITLMGNSTSINSYEFINDTSIWFTHKTTIDMFTPCGLYNTSVTFDKQP